MSTSPDWLTTSTLLDGLQDFSNAAAWERFANRFRVPVISFVRRMGLGGAEAEDVAQETLTHFANGLRDGKYDRTQGRLSRWLFGIAYRQALQARRRVGIQQAREVEMGSSTAARVEDENAQSKIWEEEWEAALLARCLEQVQREVEPTTFQAFELVAREGLSATDAAESLGVPVKTVYNAKHRILSRLRELRAAYDDS